MIHSNFLYIASLPLYAILFFWVWRRKTWKAILLYSLFYFYVVTVFALTLFPIFTVSMGGSEFVKGGVDNFIPLKSLSQLAFGMYSLSTKLKQILGNILLLFPLAFFLPLIWGKRMYFAKVLLIAITSSVFIEATQYITSNLLRINHRITDIDDFLLNLFGFILGACLYNLLKVLKYLPDGKIKTD